MTIKLAINGFGRVGRSLLRALSQRCETGLQVVAINDPAPVATLAHLFEFDSLHGRFDHPVSHTDTALDIGSGPIRMTAQTAPESLPWDDIDIVLECTGQFREGEAAARHLQNGARRVLISAPASPDVRTVIFGINHHEISPQDRIVSNGSCTTNCLVPVVHVLDQAFGIARGHMTTVHCYTGSQGLHDAPHDDLYRARAGALSMSPTTSGAARSLGLVLPHLADRITGTAIRVPTPNVSCIDLVVNTKTPVRADEVTAAMHKAAAGALRGVLAVEPRKLVSVDYAQDPHSAIYAADQTEVIDNTMLRVLAWYDNEWGFSQRMLDMATHMGGQ